MLTVAHLKAIIGAFRDTSSGQAVKSKELTLLLLDCSPDPFSRCQFTPGHITTTGMVVAPDQKRLLLVHHRRLNRWLLPGGHVEVEDDWVWDSARREVVEETSVALRTDPFPLLASIDVHGIPSHGQEPYHLHHDLLFFFRAADDHILCSPESHEVAWCSPDEFDRYALPQNIRHAYHRLATIVLKP